MYSHSQETCAYSGSIESRQYSFGTYRATSSSFLLGPLLEPLSLPPPPASAPPPVSAKGLSSSGVVASLRSSSTFHCYTGVTQSPSMENVRKSAHHPQSQLYPISRWSFVMW